MKIGRRESVPKKLPRNGAGDPFGVESQSLRQFGLYGNPACIRVESVWQTKSIDMAFRTFALQEVTLVRTHGLSPVTNLGVKYRGSDDDDALNAVVFRAGFNAGAIAWLNSAYNPTGDVEIPTVTMYTIGDGLVIGGERA